MFVAESSAVMLILMTITNLPTTYLPMSYDCLGVEVTHQERVPGAKYCLLQDVDLLNLYVLPKMSKKIRREHRRRRLFMLEYYTSIEGCSIIITMAKHVHNTQLYMLIVKGKR